VDRGRGRDRDQNLQSSPKVVGALVVHDDSRTHNGRDGCGAGVHLYEDGAC